MPSNYGSSASSLPPTSTGSKQDSGTYYATDKVPGQLPRHSDSNDGAEDVLHAVGYATQLQRSRSTWSVTFMSFVLASVPYGLSTTLIYPLTNGGPSTVIWGWLTVCLFMLCVAASLGEITSVYPLAGGVYYQTYMLAPSSYRRLAAWMAGWSFMLGNIIITLSVNFGTTLFLIGCVNIFQTEDGSVLFQPQAYQTWLIFLAITLLCNAVSSLGNRWLPLLDTAAVVFTFVGVIAIVSCVLAIAKQGRNSAAYVFGGFEVLSGWSPPGWAWCVGLLHGAYATSATGMVVSMCEEVRRPATQVPTALVSAVLLNTFAGLVFLVPLCFVLRDVAAVIADPSGQPVPAILRTAIGNDLAAFLLAIPIVILGLFCGIGCTTAASRCVWAFARDRAIPFSRRLGLARVHARLGVPLPALLLSMSVQLLLGLLYLGSSAAFNAFNSSGVLFLTLSYVAPVALSLASRRAAISARAAVNLRGLGVVCNFVSIAWCLFAIPLFSMPSTLPVSLDTMNYCSAVFIAGLAIAFISFCLWGRKNYAGPAMSPSQAEDLSHPSPSDRSPQEES